MDPEITDSHAHASHQWFEPLETLLHQMDHNHVSSVVLIQIYGEYDNSYNRQIVRDYPGRFAWVAHLDASRPDAIDQLQRLADDGVSGLRLRPTTRSSGDDPLAIWRAAERLGLAVSLLGSADDFLAPEFASLVEALPGLRIVIEHLGSVVLADARRADTFALARYPNVFIKVPGLGEFAKRRQPVATPDPWERPIPDLLPRAYRAFGPERMMWGSDFPPVAGREGYARALSDCLSEFADLSQHDRVLIFGSVARSVFPIR